jgi:hypothetical integral membrane protein (TIGR02206 family)
MAMKPGDFQLFGVAHLLILISVVLTAWGLARLVKRQPSAGGPIRRLLGIFLIVNEIVWYTYRYSTEGFRFPEGLPLQLCDAMVWLTAAALLSLTPWVFETAFLVGIAGAGMALATPDLWAPLLSYPSIYFFVAHGAIVAGLLFLIWSGLMRLRQGCVWRALIAVNVFAAMVGGFNAIFGTNYMYLCRKPQGASLLDWLGPWPVYILAGELAALLLFYLLWLLFRRGAEKA